MALVVAEFFGIVGLDVAMPTTMAELIPYLLTVMVAVFLVCGVFRVIGKIAEGLLCGFRR